MIDLPGRLETSTLGDVLGALHRGGVTGALSLDDGRHRHLLHWRNGLIHHVESPVAPAVEGRAPSGGRGEPAETAAALRHSLEEVFRIRSARLRFQAMTPGRGSAAPLGPVDFLHGRARRRDAPAPGPIARTAARDARRAALELLGFAPDARPRPGELREAFLNLARRWHPDRHPTAGERTRAALCRRFAAVAAAYERLTCGPHATS